MDDFTIPPAHPVKFFRMTSAPADLYHTRENAEKSAELLLSIVKGVPPKSFDKGILLAIASEFIQAAMEIQRRPEILTANHEAHKLAILRRMCTTDSCVDKSLLMSIFADQINENTFIGQCPVSCDAYLWSMNQIVVMFTGNA
jgi:hypothetical protein